MNRRNLHPTFQDFSVPQRYHVVVRFWVFTGIGWMIAGGALFGIMRIPGPALDIYLNDRYFVCSKAALSVAVALLLVAPLAALTIRRLRWRR